MSEINVYDIRYLNWRRVKRILSAIDEKECPLNVTNGDKFPWWIWMANTGKLRVASGAGVNKIFVVRDKGKKQFIVDGEDGLFIVSGKGKPQAITRETYSRLKRRGRR